LKIAYSCFVDVNSKDKFEKECLRFVWSLIENIGVSKSDIFITCDRNVSEGFKRILKNTIGLPNIAFVERFTSVSPPANKWLQLGSFNFDGYDYVIVNDCDKVYVSFSDTHCKDAVQAAKFVPRPTFAVFEDIFSKYDLGTPEYFEDKPDPRDKLKDTRNFINNHNGGMIILSQSYLSSVTQAWKQWIDLLLEEPEILRENQRNLDQVALSVALSSLNMKISRLPKSLDVGMNVSITDFSALKEQNRLILHVHGQENKMGEIVAGPRASQQLLDLVAQINSQYFSWLKQLGIVWDVVWPKTYSD
jgi:hypothetical protein